MLFSIVVALMVILVAAFWAYQGFFSSLIMFFETAIAMMVAFGFYEALNGVWSDAMGDGIGLPLALMLLFLATLLVLRSATDRMIPGNVTMPLPLDRAGGAVAGFFTGMILIGMALISIQMLPLGSGVLGFERIVVDDDTHKPVERGFLLKPDEFTAGFASMLSNDRFGGGNKLGVAKPDMVKSLYSARAATQTETRVFLEADDLNVSGYWEEQEIDHVKQTLNAETMVRAFETHPANSGSNKFLVFDVSVDKSAKKEKAKAIHFRPAQFRLVGPPPMADGSVTRAPKVYLACGLSDIYTHKDHGPTVVQDSQRNRLVRFLPTTDFVLSDTETKVIEEKGRFRFDVAFEVPTDFKPWYIEFKNGARVDLSSKKPLEQRPSWASYAQGAAAGMSGQVSKAKPKVGNAAGGRTHVANAIEERTGYSDELPVPLDSQDSIVSKHIQGSQLRGGDNCNFYVALQAPAAFVGSPVTQFSVPSDKKMLQVGAEALHAESVLGNALGFANRVAAQIYVRDADGKEYFAIGQYAIAEINGDWWLELQYYPNAEIPERALSRKTAKKVTRQVMKDAGKGKYKFGFIFLVDKNAKIVSFHSGKSAKQELNLD